MSRLQRNRWVTVAVTLPWLAATLACNALGGAGGPSATAQAALTQAVGSETAVAAAAATQLALPSATRPAASGAATATPAASATEAASVTAAPATETPVASETPATSATRAGGLPVVDPCSLLSADQVKSITGVDMAPPTEQSSGCLYTDAATGASTGIVVYALPGSHAGAFLDQYAASVEQFGVKIDPQLVNKLAADTKAGDTVAAVNDAIQMSVGQANFKAEKVSGVGSAAVWSWNTVLKLQEGFLLAAQPGALVAIVFAGNGTLKEDAIKPVIQGLVSGILAALPPDFALPAVQPTAVPSGPAIDTCMLASASDLQAVLGAKPGDGMAKNGNCIYSDASKKYSVRLFVYPAGPAAIGALTGAAPLILLNNPTSLPEVTADLRAGDLVGAVRDMAATPISTTTQVLQPVDGLGASAFYFGNSAGLDRVAYMASARPNYLIGFQAQLPAGDTASTVKAGTTLLSDIMASLPDSFSVKGVP